MTVRRILSSLSLALLTVSITAGPASATTLPGIAGRAMFGADASCFTQPTFAGITSTCVGTRAWVVTIPNTGASTSLTIKAHGQACTTGCIGVSYPSCRVYKVPQGGTTAVPGNPVNVDGPNKTLGTYTQTVSPTDTFHVVCEFTVAAQQPSSVKPLLSVSWQ